LATVDEILDDGSCSVIFDKYGTTEVTQACLLSLLHSVKHLVIMFGRLFLKRFALCYLSVCDVDVLWLNTWMNQDETWHGGSLGPGHIVLDGDPAPLPKRGTAPNFRPMSVVTKVWMDQDASDSGFLLGLICALLIGFA